MKTATQTTSSREIRFRRPWLYPKQEAAIFTDARVATIEASTKSGKTTACLVWLIEQAVQGQPGNNYWWVAPVYTQTEIAYRRAKVYLPRWVYTANDTKLTIELLNGTVLWFKSGEKPDHLYGEDVHACVIDEATRVKEESWHAIRSTLTATRGPIRIIGNVKGRKNWAYRLARRAEQGIEGYSYARLTAHDAIEAGVLTQEEVDDARAVLPENVFRELYLAEPGSDEGNPFGIEAIRACISHMSTEPPVAWGWDLAKSSDYSVGIALDKNCYVCGFHRFQGDWEFAFRVILRYTAKVRAFVDSTGVGDPVVERLRREGGRNFHGYKMNTPMLKQQIMERLAIAIQDRGVHFPEGPIVHELEAIEYEYSRNSVHFSAPRGMHDDCVVALGLALYAYEGARRMHTVATIGNVTRASHWRRS